jgi:hypothetical protein
VPICSGRDLRAEGRKRFPQVCRKSPNFVRLHVVIPYFGQWAEDLLTFFCTGSGRLHYLEEVVGKGWSRVWAYNRGRRHHGRDIASVKDL